jgi:phage recombination protein Bet
MSDNTPVAKATKNKVTMRDRKKAQPKALVFFSPEEKAVIKDTVAKSLNDAQAKIFFYTCQALGLNPLINEIACVTYKNRQTGEVSMSIQVMRDGFLTIAHRSGKFAGLESGVNLDEGGRLVSGWAKVYHKDFTVPVYQEADFEEYNAPEKGGKPTLWKSKPKTMIKKVAESMALRKAFNVNGVYAPEEMDKELMIGGEKTPLELTDGADPATPEQIATIQKLAENVGRTKEVGDLTSMTKQEAVEAMNNLLGYYPPRDK